MGVTSSSRSSPTPTERRRAVARILGPRGLKGDLRVELLTDWPQRISPGADVWLEGDEVPRRIDRLDSGGRVPVIHFENVVTREAAEAFIGRYLELPSPTLEDGAYFWDDLIGLRVEEPDGTPVGELVEVFRAGGNEVYRIVGEAGERLVPALRSAVARIDIEKRLMVVTADDAEEVG